MSGKIIIRENKMRTKELSAIAEPARGCNSVMKRGDDNLRDRNRVMGGKGLVIKTGKELSAIAEPAVLSNTIIARSVYALFIILVSSFVLLSLITPSVSALGVTPARTTIIFEPNLEREFSFSVINSENSVIEVSLSVIGELGEYISLEENSFSLEAGGERRVNGRINLPAELTPGGHKGEIVVSEVFSREEAEETFVGAYVGLITEISVLVPYPGKYAEADLSVFVSDDNEKIDFVIPVTNRGGLNIENATVVVDIFDSFGEKVATLSGEEISIDSSGREEIKVVWENQDITLGKYRASARVVYDGKLITIDRAFSVGEPIISIERIGTGNYSLGGIAKFEILVSSNWMDKIEGSSAILSVYGDNGELIAKPTSALYDLPPLDKTLLLVYWDSAGIKEGVYNSSVTVKYGENYIDKKIKIDVRKNSIEVLWDGYAPTYAGANRNTMIMIGLVILLLVLIILNILWFIFVRRRTRGRKK